MTKEVSLTTAIPTLRARNLGIPLSGAPGACNAITDVPGLEVGYTTLWSGSGALKVGEGPVRTGITAILPRGRSDARPCFGGSFALNAAGEFTGLAWLEERGLCEGPILITNTHSVGIVRDSAIQWMRRQKWPFEWAIPIVGETYDGSFNDIDGGHIEAQHVFDALDAAQSGSIAEGNVGGGTGMITYWYKGGTGTSSRRLEDKDGGYTVGVLVQSNYGERRQLRIGGIPMGEHLADDLPRFLDPSLLSDELRKYRAPWCGPGDGSIIVVVATDAPLLPHQLKRLAKRPALAIGRLGGVGAATSGDIFLAISTANAGASEERGALSAPSNVKLHPNLAMTSLFEAAIDATEEAILNALVAGEAAEGANRLYVPRLPHSRVKEKLRDHRLLRSEL
jgi:L-aminopeptidase/D-esterase-like protein